MKQVLHALTLIIILNACEKTDTEINVAEYPATYAEISSINLGGAGAAEITTYDPQTKRLFAVNNGSVNKIDVIDFSNPSAISVIHSISITPYGGFVNSVDVKNGKLAAAIESINKQEAGKIVVFNTTTYAEEKQITVGALPDMVSFSPDGKYIVSANEGEPNASYTNDPEGSVSIISVHENYSVKTINFNALQSQLPSFTAAGFRIAGLNKNYLQDIEPEYVSISKDSKIAWITLQENNAIAVFNLDTKELVKILPLGFKDHNLAENAIDVSDKDGGINFSPTKVWGLYMPDAIANMEYNGRQYLFTANEGDSREYTAHTDVKRLSTLNLDASAFPNAASLKTDAIMGRLNIINTMGDTDGDGDFDALYSMGGRSFSIWDGNTGSKVWDSKNELDQKAKELGIYDDARSDDKSVEPEAITLGKVGSKMLAFVGLERADAFAVYDVTNPTTPQFVKMVKTGDAPEGILFISATNSPIGQSLVVISSENDGLIKVYKANKL